MRLLPAVATVTAVVALAAPAVAQEPVPLPPRVDRVEPDVDAVTIAPAVSAVELADGASLVEHTIVNGGDTAVTLTLETEPVVADADGAPRPSRAGDEGTGPTRTGPSLTVAGDTVHLAPGERARLTSLLTRPAGTAPGAVALIARGGGAHLRSLVAVSEPGADPPAVTVELSSVRRGAHASMQMTATGSPAVVDVALRSRVWGSLGISERQLGAVLVLPDVPRTITADVDAPVLPGPLTVDVAVAPRDGEVVRATATRWSWSGRPWLVAATLVVVVTAVLVARTLRRRRRDLPC